MANTEAVRVTIFNQTYTVLATDDAAELHQLAQTVDDLMVSISRSGNLDSTRTAVLACLHLADQLRNLQREFDALKHNVDVKSERCADLLDRILAG